MSSKEAVPEIKEKFSIRALLLTMVNNIKYVLMLTVVNELAVSALYSHFENVSFGVSLWWAEVTGTTTGFGDEFPVTTGGKVLAAYYMRSNQLLGYVLAALIVAAVLFNKDRWSHSEQEHVKSELDELLKLARAQADKDRDVSS